MLKISALAILVLTVGITHCSIFEAYNSDDVAYFVKNDQDRNRAIMFYDAFQEEGSYLILNNVEKINGVFLNKGEQGRSNDMWVDNLNDRVNMLRVDTLNPYNEEAVDSFHISRAPFLVILEDGNIVFEEALRDSTYDHLRDVLDTSNSGYSNDYGYQSQNYGGGSNSYNSFDNNLQRYGGNNQPSNNQNGGFNSYDAVDRAEDSLQSANQHIRENRQTVESSLKELQDQRKSLETYKEIEDARQKAEKAKDDAEKAKKDYEAAQKDLNEHINKLNKEEDEKQRAQIVQNIQSNSYQPKNANSFSLAAPRVYTDNSASKFSTLLSPLGYNLANPRSWNGYAGRY